MQKSMLSPSLSPRQLTALITVVLLLTTYAGISTAKQIHVRTTVITATACPKVESCHTLQDIVQNSSQYFLPYTTFTGYHKVNYSNNVLIKDVNNITLIGEMHASSVIQCISAFGLTFMNITNLTISNLKFELCGAPIPKKPRPSLPANKLLQILKYSATLYLMQASQVHISDTQVHNST